MEGLVPRKREDVEKYVRCGAWLNITLGAMLDRAADVCPEREALVDGVSRLTYAGLRRKANGLAAGLSRAGIGRGDCVLLQLPNWSEFVYTFFALQKVGAVAVLLLERHRQTEVNYFCSLTRAKAWILPERYRNTDYVPLIEDAMAANPSLKQVITVRPPPESRFIGLESLIAEPDFEAAVADARLGGQAPDPNDVAFVIPTGGTTGLPKAVPRTHNDAICDARYKAEARGQTGADTCMISVPLEHNLGLAALNGTVFTMGRTVLLDSTRAEDLCATLQREKATRAPLVPALLSRLVAFDGLANYELSSLKAFYVGGARTPPEVIASVHRRLGKVYMGAFGMSEGPSCSTRDGDGDDIVLTSIGRPCCPYDEFVVVDAGGARLPPDGEGELMARGPGVFAGYLSNPEENAIAFSDGGFFRTGDLARIDAAGNIRITGRIKDIIIRGGENISPADIESLLRGHPDVEDVAVVGMPDQEFGERACAYIKARSGVTLGLDDVVSFLRGRGASVLQLPERVELIAEMPLTGVGKPDKKALREDIRKRLRPTA